jgi:alanyl-tRNA synthetase
VDVADVQVFGGFILHIGTVRNGSLKVGDKVRCRVDYERRGKVAPNHTMTHVLNYALRQVLGNGVDQKGSVVQAEKLRFDFSSNKGATPEQLQQVEAIVNDKIDKVRGGPCGSQGEE